MSDTESYRSASPMREILDTESNTDIVFNDHRNQRSLPIRGMSMSASQNTSPKENKEPDKQPSDNQASTPPPPIHPRARTGSIADLEDAKDTHRTNPAFNRSLRTDFLMSEDEDVDPGMSMPFVRGSGGSLAAAARRGRTRSRSRSFSEQLKCLVNPKEGEENIPQGGILKNSSSLKKTKFSKVNHGDNNDDTPIPMMKIKTNDTSNSDHLFNKRERRASRSSIDSDADSHASRSSQETEEDVCFPMLREHVKVRGIDFDEIEEFIKEEREQEMAMKEQQRLIAERTAMRVLVSERKSNSSMYAKSIRSTAANKYTPKNVLRKTTSVLTKLKSRNDGGGSGYIPSEKPHFDSSTSNEEFDVKSETFPAYQCDSSSSENVKFGGTKINDGDSILPDRFSFFNSDSEETIHASDIPSLVAPGQSVSELFRNGEGTWWLDCVCPTDAEMKMLAKAFGIHPLTAEDIRMQETREKVELFRTYYFVCFHTFEPDKESEDFLEPINVYIVVFREGILSFHFSPISHPANVRRRVRQLRDYVDVSADWLCYALIDDITDGFAPAITAIEYEADSIEDSVFVARELDFGNMLQRIGEARRRVMTLMRLLAGKADVIKMFAKRCQDEAATNVGHNFQSHTNLSGMYSMQQGISSLNYGHYPGPGHAPSTAQQHVPNQSGIAQPRADIALYLGDIQDHVVTMYQNLLAYEKIFSRSHANYLAQLQVESLNSNNKVTEILSKVTIIGTLFVPLNLIPGLFGMNVTVPGEQKGDVKWFFGIVGVMIFLAFGAFFVARGWLNTVSNATPTPSSSRKSIKSLGLRGRTKDVAKSIISYPNKYD